MNPNALLQTKLDRMMNFSMLEPNEVITTFYRLTRDIVEQIKKNIHDKMKNHDVKFIGFWRAHRWGDKLLILVDHGKIGNKLSDDGSPAAFEIVASLIKKKDKFEFIVGDDELMNDLRPFLNITGNVSDPPKIIGSLSKRPFAESALINAREFWDKSFTKNAAAVTHGRFKAVTQLDQEVFEKLTRLKTVVDKEDWFKIAVYLSPNCDSLRSLSTNCEELREATELVKRNILHFQMMTAVEDFKIDEDGENRIDIIPAFRLWKYGIYSLFIRKDKKVHRFFLCKHCAGDCTTLAYDPYKDFVMADEIRNKSYVNKKFFYILPNKFSASRDDEIPIFDSLTDVYNKISACLAAPSQ